MGPSPIEPQGRAVDPAQLAQIGIRAPLDRVTRPLGVALETLGLQLRAGEQFTAAELRSIVSLVQTTLEVFAAPSSGERTSQADSVGRGDPTAGGDALLREAAVVVRAMQGDLAHVFTQQREMISALAPLLQELLLTTGDALAVGAGETGEYLAAGGAGGGEHLGAGDFAAGAEPSGAGVLAAGGGFGTLAGGRTHLIGVSSPAALARLMAGMADAIQSLGRQDQAGALAPASLASAAAGLVEAIAALQDSLLPQALQGADRPAEGHAPVGSGRTAGDKGAHAAHEPGTTGDARGAGVRAGATRVPPAVGGMNRLALSPVASRLLQALALVIARLQALLPPGATPRSLALALAEAVVLVEEQTMLVGTDGQQAESPAAGELLTPSPHPSAMPRGPSAPARAVASPVGGPASPSGTAESPAAQQPAALSRPAQESMTAPASSAAAQRSSASASGSPSSASPAASAQRAIDAAPDAARLAATIARIIAGLEQLSPTPAGAAAQSAASAAEQSAAAAAAQLESAAPETAAALALGLAAGEAGQNLREADARPSLTASTLAASLPTELGASLATVKSQLQAMLSVAVLEAAAQDAEVLQGAELPRQSGGPANLGLLAAGNWTLAGASSPPPHSEPFDPYRWGLVAALNYRAERRRPRERTPDPEHCEHCGRLLVRTLTDALVCPAGC